MARGIPLILKNLMNLVLKDNRSLQMMYLVYRHAFPRIMMAGANVLFLQVEW